MKIISLNENKVFQHIYKRGIVTVGQFVVIYCLPNKLGFNRLGITVSKKIGKAVIRNLAKRRIKEIYIKNFHKIKQGFDIVIVARFKINGSSLNSVELSFLNMLKKNNLFHKNR